MKLVASLIVRDELERYLAPCVSSLLEFCDEVRILDDGSNEVDVNWMARQQRVSWKQNTGPSFFQHEGRARQELLKWTLAADADYVLSIDADEFIADPRALRECMAEGYSVYSLDMHEVWNATRTNLHVRVDNMWRPRRCPILWRTPDIRQGRQWQIPDVQLACGREPLAVRRTRARSSGTNVLHFGWACKADRVARAERYFEHDRGNFHSDRHLQSILWDDERVVTKIEHWPASLSGVRRAITERAARQ